MSADGSERRQHTRLQIRLEISVQVGAETRKAELHDISQGGACLLVGGGEPARGQPVELSLPGDGQALTLQASVVRSTPRLGGALTAVRFRDVGAAQLDALDQLLGDLLASSGGGVRQHPRISHRLRVPVESTEDMLAVVENISLGGLAMKVEQELAVGDKLMLVLPNAEGEDMLSLGARVANQRRLDQTNAPTTWLVGLTFDDLSEQTRVLLNALLVSLLGSSE